MKPASEQELETLNTLEDRRKDGGALSGEAVDGSSDFVAGFDGSLDRRFPKIW